MIKSVGEIAFKIWPVVYYLNHFWENLTLTFDLNQVKVIGTWVIECALLKLMSCTLVPSMKSVSEIASEI